MYTYVCIYIYIYTYIHTYTIIIYSESRRGVHAGACIASLTGYKISDPPNKAFWYVSFFG